MAEVEGTESTESTEPPTAEETASAKGWLPLDAWTEAGNDPAEHVDALTYNIRGDFIGDIKKYQSEVRELQKNQKRTAELLTESNKRAREEGIREAEERHAKAVEEGDVDGAKKALADVKTASEPVETPADPFSDWMDDNPEFKTDRDLWNAFRQEDEWLAFQSGGVKDIKAHMDQVKDAVKAKLPEKFGNPARNETPAVESTSTRTRQTKSSKPSYSSLDDTQKAFCDEFVAMGAMTREEYIQSLVDSGDLK